MRWAEFLRWTGAPAALVPLLLIAGSVSKAGAGPVNVQAGGGPAIGLWYTAWWTADDQFHHWSHCHIMPVRGRYTAGDPTVIAQDYALMRDLAINFLIMDDTNGVGNDGGRINDNIRAWFDFMDGQAPDQRIPICIGGGGEMRAGGRAAEQRAADFYWTNWAQRPSYFRLNGKPLLLIDTDKNYGPGDFTDPRFTVRWVYNGDNHATMLQRKTWGWGSYEPAPILKESMSIWPGHRFPDNVAKLGKDPLEDPREGGRLYARGWLRVLKARPAFVTVADWNNFQEETAIEDSYSWEDPKGYAAPDLYRRITRAYSRLRTAAPVAGETYRDEHSQQLYRFDGRQFRRVAAPPGWGTVIVAPAGILDRMRRRTTRLRPDRSGIGVAVKAVKTGPALTATVPGAAPCCRP